MDTYCSLEKKGKGVRERPTWTPGGTGRGTSCFSGDTTQAASGRTSASDATADSGAQTVTIMSDLRETGHGLLEMMSHFPQQAEE